MQGHTVDLYSMSYSHYMITNDIFIERKKINELVGKKFDQYFHKRLDLINPWVRDLEVSRYSYELAARYLEIEKYDIIHTQDVLSARSFQRVAPHKPSVVTIHGSLYKELFSFDNRKSGAVDKKYIYDLEYAGSKFVDQAILPSRWLATTFDDMYSLEKEQYDVIPNGLDIVGFEEEMNLEPKNVPIVNGKKIILCPARLVREKGHKVLIEALYHLREVRKDWVCWIVGDGVLFEQLLQLCMDFKLEKYIQFFGNRLDVPILMKKADVVVLPSLQENCPYALIEAMVAGKPVVASDAGGIPELIKDKHSGLIFTCGDSIELSEKLDLILRDEKLARKLARNGQNQANEHYSLEVMTDRTLQIYERAIKKKQGGQSDENNQKGQIAIESKT